METTHRFSTPLARDLFQLGCESMQAQLAEAYRGVPTELTPEDVNRLAAIHDEVKSEGRTLRPFRTNPHGE